MLRVLSELFEKHHKGWRVEGRPERDPSNHVTNCGQWEKQVKTDNGCHVFLQGPLVVQERESNMVTQAELTPSSAPRSHSTITPLSSSVMLQ